MTEQISSFDIGLGLPLSKRYKVCQKVQSFSWQVAWKVDLFVQVPPVVRRKVITKDLGISDSKNLQSLKSWNFLFLILFSLESLFLSFKTLQSKTIDPESENVSILYSKNGVR